jgi:hypothetical protein
VSETGRAGYSASFSGDCSENGSITLAGNDVKSCTITNDDVGEEEEEPATLRVVKIVVGGNKTAADFTINVAGVNASPASFAGSAAGTTVTLDAGAYSVTESSHPGYDVTYSATCSGTIEDGGSVTCTVTNTAKSEPPPGPECPPGTEPGAGKDGEGGNDNCRPVTTTTTTPTPVTTTEPTPTEPTPTETFEPPTLPDQPKPTPKPKPKPKPAAKAKPAGAAQAARAPLLPPTLAYTP